MWWERRKACVRSTEGVSCIFHILHFFYIILNFKVFAAWCAHAASAMTEGTHNCCFFPFKDRCPDPEEYICPQSWLFIHGLVQQVTLLKIELFPHLIASDFDFVLNKMNTWPKYPSAACWDDSPRWCRPRSHTHIAFCLHLGNVCLCKKHCSTATVVKDEEGLSQVNISKNIFSSL